MSEFDLFLGGDVQVLEARIEQQVLVDLVSCDFARRSPVHLRMGWQMDFKHLQRHKNCINAHLNSDGTLHPPLYSISAAFSVENK